MKIQDLSTFKIPETFRGASVIKVQLWWIVQSTFFGCSPQFMYGWRNWLLNLFGAQVGQNAKVRPSARITYPWKVSIGEGSWIGDEVVLYSLGNITIGQNAVISQRSYLCTGSHDLNSSSFAIYEKPIFIEEEAWVATDVYIAPGVTVGRGSVIGARSSVFNDIPPMKVCFGNPAKPVRGRGEES